MKTKLWYVVSYALFAGLVFTGCSSSSNDSGTPGTTPGPGGGGTNLSTMVAVGAMTKGSVIVNGVRFEDTTANITADDTPKTAAFLADGMTVKVKGTVNADGTTGTAQEVAVVNEARGAIQTKGTDTLTVHGQTVLVDGGTVLAGTGVTSIGDLAQGENVEVHGGRDDVGVIHATRVEKLAAGAVEDEVRGAVSGKTATQFTIGGQAITFDGSTVMVPAGATFVDGDVVEVHLSGTAATQISVEHLNHPEFEPVEGQELSVQGILKGFSQAGAFSVGTQQVQLLTGATSTNPTRIDGGVLADLVDGMKVEAEGHNVANGVLTAEKITIKDNIRIEANADGSGSADVLSKTVDITSGTRLSNLASSASITAGDGLRIRGFINRDGTTITATRVDKQSNPVQPGKTIIQGPVSTIDATGHTFKILGVTVSAASSIARPNDDSSNDNNVQTMSLDSFFSSLADGQTIVKAKGTFSAGALDAVEIELE